MRGTRIGLSLAGAALLGVIGCWTTDKAPKPPPIPEEFVMPPEADARFSQPPTFPKKAMNEGFLRKDAEKDDMEPGKFKGPNRSGPGASAY
jgi:hypothetical protein